MSILLALYLSLTHPAVIPCGTDQDCQTMNPLLADNEEAEDYRLDQAEQEEWGE